MFSFFKQKLLINKDIFEFFLGEFYSVVNLLMQLFQLVVSGWLFFISRYDVWLDISMISSCYFIVLKILGLMCGKMIVYSSSRKYENF
jgi:hypothetical protein